MNTNTSKKQEGFVLVVVAVVLIALIGFLALAVDVGVLYSARTSAQEVAGAAGGTALSLPLRLVRTQ